jgi:(p)ppGpp synthase/HD superfamily hydrolase
MDDAAEMGDAAHGLYKGGLDAAQVCCEAGMCRLEDVSGWLHGCVLLLNRWV